MAEYDAIIIGSGIGGLSAATRLVQKNFGVLLLEASSDFGGYIGPLVYDEYAFDIGIHYLGKLGPREPFKELLDRLGLEEFKFVELDPDGFDRYVFPDFEFRFCKGRDQLADRFIREFPGEEKNIHRFLDIVEKVDDANQPEKMEKDGFLSWIPYLFKHPVILKYGRLTYQAVLDRITTNKRLQSIFSAPLFDIAVGPQQSSAVAAFWIWGHFLNGAYYPLGGSRALRDAFVQGLLRGKAELVHSSPVNSLSRKNDRWVVKTAKGDEYTSRVVVSNADPAVTICSLLNRTHVPNRIFKKAERLQPSGSIFCTLIGTDLDLPSLGITTANIVHYGSWDLTPLYEGWLGSTIPKIEQGFFLNSPSVRDSEGRFAPDGQHVLQLLIGGNFESFEQWASLAPGQRGEDYEELKRSIGKQMVTEAERYVPELSRHLSFIEYVTPLDCRDRVRAVRGGIYGPAHTPNQMGPGRFQSLMCGADGLFLAGAGIFGCSLYLSGASGFLAAEKAAVFLNRRKHNGREI
jgi:phytoene dehydrogenase-like protein